MRISWERLEAGGDAEDAWRRVSAAAPDATFFQTWDWADTFCAAVTRWTPDPVAIEFGDGNLAVLPMLRRTDSEHRQSMAPWVYGGPLFLRPPGELHLQELARIPSWYTDVVLYDNPFSNHAWEPEGVVRWKIHTQVVDLSAGFDRVVRRFRRMTRQHCRTAEAAGLTVSVARTQGQLDAYYEAYLDSRARWGDNATSFYPRGLFRGLFRLQEQERGVRLWVAELDGRVVSGVLVLYLGDHSVAWHSATCSEGLSLHASPYVHMTAIREGCREGRRWYDFNPSGKLAGVEFFKEGFATQYRRFDMYHSPTFTRPDDSDNDEPPAAVERSRGMSRSSPKTTLTEDP
jgi:CelD/BcsL family acetyltransferase involved in cellulose biosynthesis